MYIDTHAHLYLDQFNNDIDSVLRNAQDNKVHKIFLPNIDSTTTKSMKDLVAKNPELLYPMMGLHPCSVKENYKDELNVLIKELEESKFYGIGETGIDLYWDKTFKKEQIKAFEYQIELAYKYDLPIIIHSRDSLDLTIDIIAQNQNGNLRGIFHCFNGDKQQAKLVLDANFHMGLGGVITFKKANLDETVKYIPIDQMVLETDAPYLSPVPHRGKRNESAYIPLVAIKVAQVRSQEANVIMEGTSLSASKLFRV